MGEQLAVGEWLTVDQAMIDKFADATGDHQWIHIDRERAAKGPFGTTVAHGFLTLSLLPKLAESALKVDDVRMGVNYGLNRVRFPAPVPVGQPHPRTFEAAELRAARRRCAAGDGGDDGARWQRQAGVRGRDGIAPIPLTAHRVHNGSTRLYMKPPSSLAFAAPRGGAPAASRGRAPLA